MNGLSEEKYQEYLETLKEAIKVAERDDWFGRAAGLKMAKIWLEEIYEYRPTFPGDEDRVQAEIDSLIEDLRSKLRLSIKRQPKG